MKLNELITKLEEIRDEQTGNGMLDVAIAGDPEGNGFFTVEIPFHSFGRIEDSVLSHGNEDDDDDYEDEIDDRREEEEEAWTPNAIVLWPNARLRD